MTEKETEIKVDLETGVRTYLGVPLPADKHGKTIRGRINMALAVILTSILGFIGVFYVDVRWALYLLGGFALFVILIAVGIAYELYGLVIAAYLIYLAYRLVALGVTGSVGSDKNERWAVFEAKVFEKMEKEGQGQNP